MCTTRLVKLLLLPCDFCVFCTETQVSTRQFHQFYILTKISIEICLQFVYNAFIGVIAHLTARRGEETFPKGDLIYHEHR